MPVQGDGSEVCGLSKEVRSCWLLTKTFCVRLPRKSYTEIKIRD
jgi:hypothetical protein